MRGRELFRFVNNVPYFMQIIGSLSILAGLAHLFAFFTGHDWPLHYANWSDLWPH
jgi:hypothetical protein